MGVFHKGILCGIKDGVKIKNKAVISASRKSFYCFLVVKELPKGKVLVTGIYENNRQNYCIPIMLDGRKLWINCALYIVADISCLKPVDGYLEDDVIFRVNEKHPYMLKKREERKRKHEFLLERRKEEEKMWKAMECEAKGKNKKYPYGSGMARREAPSARGIMVVQGGRCSPR